MATEAKRLKVDDSSKTRRLERFLQWCDDVGLVLSNKVYVSAEGTVSEYGMLAKDDIEEGEVLFTIPRSALLHQGTTKVAALLEKEKSALQNSSGWVPLLLALLYEYTSSESHWGAYLSLWTDFKTLDHPIFWSKKERERLLQGTGVPEAVDRDESNIHKEYTTVVLPFMTRHPDLWNPSVHTLELYTQLVAFIMAYSFQEPQSEDETDDEDEDEEELPSPPVMVPMADMLNHISNHNANLEFMQDCLKMVCVRPVQKGQEVFNTYGQMANWQLLHMYGFTEPYPSNSNDTADIPAANLYTVCTQGIQSDSDRQLVEEQWEMVCQLNDHKETFVFGQQGCLTDTELHTTLKVLCLSQQEFSEFKENEGWEEEDEEEDDENITHLFSDEGLPELKPPWKRLLHQTARLTLRSYANGVEDVEQVLHSDRLLIEDEAAFAKLSSREQKALHVRYGQKKILYKVLELTAT